VTLLADLEEFVVNHRPHGPLTADATELAVPGRLDSVIDSTNSGGWT